VQTLTNVGIPFDEDDLVAAVEKAQKAAAQEGDGPKEIYNTDAAAQVEAKREYQVQRPLLSVGETASRGVTLGRCRLQLCHLS
jgi:hypothetical protein